ncbi:pyrroline-5-carboxylate reductase [uncultured Parolsenella sp.]|uniref:pyrroline-5-carboxylate reductase n=1 Tax=uncultured Parolsenella sp. TaxID=2083008 RepID=UPI0025D59D7E|nr:pyrroline-5-carboxylate reductase [uncultured Parolsenella sp.]
MATETAPQALDVRVGVIGGGSMGGAIARGLVASDTLEGANVIVCDHGAAKLAALAEAGVTTRPDADALLAEDPSVVVLAVKPQVLGALLDEVSARLAGKLVVSIAAGVTLETLESRLPGARVVRVMPNLPVSVRSGASAVAGGTAATTDDVELVRTLFAALGSAGVMREDQLDAEGAVVGCGPAYFALMVDALTRAGIRAGLPAKASREMVNATMLGVAEMLKESGEHPRTYMERVTSPGGTTAAALYELEPLMVEGAYAAVDAALERTAELARG